MGLSDFARALDDGANRRGTVRLRAKGWLPQLTPYMGYGSVHGVKILARAIMAPPDQPNPLAAFLDSLPRDAHGSPMYDLAMQAAEAGAQAQRGWRQFFTTQVGYLPVTVRIMGQGGSVVREIRTRTDRGGYLDLLVEDHGLAPGWHEVELIPLAGEPVRAPVMIVAPGAKRGLISDIDDTILVTWMPRAFTAAWNALVVRTNMRQPVPGMAEFYRELIADLGSDGEPACSADAGAGTSAGRATTSLDSSEIPVFYISGGAWNTYPNMVRFLRAHGFPLGPMLLTDWGPTPTGIFRNTVGHKNMQLRNLLIMFPGIEWILVGDDGQHDPIIYDDLVREHPGRVRAIALRELAPIEQVLSHGTAEPVETRRRDADTERHGVPVVRGADGATLLRKLRSLRTN